MAYEGSGRLPLERASKVGHIKIITEPTISRVIEAWESTAGDAQQPFGERTGTVDLEAHSAIENVVAIDGSFVSIPHVLHRYKRLGFISVGAVVLTRSDLRTMRENPIGDPRERQRILANSSFVRSTVLPLSGVRITGETLVDTLRGAIDDSLRRTALHDTLKFLVYREWVPGYVLVEHLDCFRCRGKVDLVKSASYFNCPACGHRHSLSDYLNLVNAEPEDWATEESVIGLANVMEALVLVGFLRTALESPRVFERTLFVKDGPLLLRAQLSRLVEPLRALLTFIRDQGHVPHVVGVEKTGDLVEHLPLIAEQLPDPGDFFLPSVRYLHERVHGMPWDATSYRNRVQYGSKVVVRLGPEHVVVLNVPTGDFLTDPRAEDLHGFEGSLAVLAEMLSYSYENALVPLVVANSVVSISQSPSAEILNTFAERLLDRARPIP